MHTSHRVEGGDEAVAEPKAGVVRGNAVRAAFTVPEEQAHHTRHARDEVERVLHPIPDGIGHADGVEANAQPVHWVALARQGSVDRIKAFGQGTASGQVGTERGGLFRGRELFVEQEIDDVLNVQGGQFSDGIAAVVHAFGRGHERCSARADGDATEPGVEVRGGDGEKWLVVAHRCTEPASAALRINPALDRSGLSRGQRKPDAPTCLEVLRHMQADGVPFHAKSIGGIDARAGASNLPPCTHRTEVL